MKQNPGSRNPFKAAYAYVVRMDLLDLTLTFTLLLLLFHSGSFWYLKHPIRLLCMAGLVFRPIARNPTFWFCICCFLVVANIHFWYKIDNHKYLMTYWCLGVFFCLETRNPLKNLAFNGRLLIGLCFLFATFWKSIVPDFRDGTFFYYTLLT
ncbi:MAG: hypothetical protein AAF492_17760, partial [Verrucomicrobiota bacterium]